MITCCIPQLHRPSAAELLDDPFIKLGRNRNSIETLLLKKFNLQQPGGSEGNWTPKSARIMTPTVNEGLGDSNYALHSTKNSNVALNE